MGNGNWSPGTGKRGLRAGERYLRDGQRNTKQRQCLLTSLRGGVFADEAIPTALLL